jgi:hypothetical protein
MEMEDLTRKTVEAPPEALAALKVEPDQDVVFRVSLSLAETAPDEVREYLQKITGTYCWTFDDKGYWKCAICRKHHGPGDSEQHVIGEGKDEKACCPDCCPACRKRNGLPPKDPMPPPTEQELAEGFIARRETEDRGMFAGQLATARSMWHKYPELVTAPEFPESHLNAFRAYYEGDPPADDISEDVLDPDYMPELLQRAREFAASQLQRPEATA